MSDRFAQLRHEFPDYPVDSLPEIPAHWESRAWHHDEAPMFEAGAFFVAILEPGHPFIADGSARFFVYLGEPEADNGMGIGDCIAESNDWAEVLRLTGSNSGGGSVDPATAEAALNEALGGATATESEIERKRDSLAFVGAVVRETAAGRSQVWL